MPGHLWAFQGGPSGLETKVLNIRVDVETPKPSSRDKFEIHTLCVYNVYIIINYKFNEQTHQHYPADSHHSDY
jgi:hypothetical protein